MALKIGTRSICYLLSLGFLSACEGFFVPPVSDNAERNVKISSNATLFATRDGVKDWVVGASGNSAFNPNFISLLVEDPNKQYTAMFVCASSNTATPHRVYYYLATVAELGEINHLCRKAEASITYTGVYGEVAGLNVNGGERARVALGANNGQWAYEAYSFKDVDGRYDILGYVAQVQQDGSLAPVRYHKHGSVRLTNPPSRVDLDFRENGDSSFSVPVGAASLVNLNVAGLPVDGSGEVQVVFRSELNSNLTLAEGSGALQYYGFPIDVMYSSTVYEQKKEGHIASATQKDAQQRVMSEVVQLFKKPQNVEISLAQGAIAAPAAQLVDHTAGVTASASWNSASDAVHGGANLYHWVMTGKAADSVVCLDCGGTIVSQVEWHVLVTPGWLAVNSGASPAFRLDPVVDLSTQWFQGWNFAAGTSLQKWHVSAYYAKMDREINDKSVYTPQEALLTFLFNREFVDGLGYAQTLSYSP